MKEGEGGGKKKMAVPYRLVLLSFLLVPLWYLLTIVAFGGNANSSARQGRMIVLSANGISSDATEGYESPKQQQQHVAAREEPLAPATGTTDSESEGISLKGNSTKSLSERGNRNSGDGHQKQKKQNVKGKGNGKGKQPVPEAAGLANDDDRGGLLNTTTTTPFNDKCRHFIPKFHIYRSRLLELLSVLHGIIMNEGETAEEETSSSLSNSSRTSGRGRGTGRGGRNGTGALDYCLAPGGSAIGYARHNKQPIPWDDDIDIELKPEDHSRLIQTKFAQGKEVRTIQAYSKEGKASTKQVVVYPTGFDGGIVVHLMMKQKKNQDRLDRNQSQDEEEGEEHDYCLTDMESKASPGQHKFYRCDSPPIPQINSVIGFPMIDIFKMHPSVGQYKFPSRASTFGGVPVRISKGTREPPPRVRAGETGHSTCISPLREHQFESHLPVVKMPCATVMNECYDARRKTRCSARSTPVPSRGCTRIAGVLRARRSGRNGYDSKGMIQPPTSTTGRRKLRSESGPQQKTRWSREPRKCGRWSG